MYYVYILLCKRDQRLYIGRTDNLRQRLSDHASGRVQTTRHRGPVELEYYEAYRFRNDSKLRERQLKQFGSSYQGLRKRLSLP